MCATLQYSQREVLGFQNIDALLLSATIIWWQWWRGYIVVTCDDTHLMRKSEKKRHSRRWLRHRQRCRPHTSSNNDRHQHLLGLYSADLVALARLATRKNCAYKYLINHTIYRSHYLFILSVWFELTFYIKICIGCSPILRVLRSF